MNLVKHKNSKKLLSYLLCIALLFSACGMLISLRQSSQNAYGAYEYYDNEGFDTKSYSGSYSGTFKNGVEKSQWALEEGIVLLKNEQSTYRPDQKVLPLPEGAKINLFGNGAYASETGLSGSSSGGSTNGSIVTFRTALDNEGFVRNSALSTLYGNGTSLARGGMDSINYGFAINEKAQSAFTNDAKNSYASFGADASIVVFSRVGGEGYDLTRTQSTGSGSSTAVSGARSASDHYLQLDQNETDLLKALDADSSIQDIIVIINSANTMELGFLDDPGHYAYSSKIKAAMFICVPGRQGFPAVARILNGKVNPSGHLVDTYTRDHTKDPTYQNFGNNKIASGNSNNSQTFVHYDEDIYLGYRYWETRGLTEGITTPKTFSVSNNFVDSQTTLIGTTTTTWDNWYKAHVVYPFGYGLSYTNFEWTLKSQTIPNGTNLKDDDTIQAVVTVKNIGTVPGKEVVQLYYSAPYYTGGISKAHVILGGYEKTKLLEAGESQDLTLTLKVSDMKSYDWSDANNNGFKGYELDAGKYTIYLANDAHSWADENTIKLNYEVPVGGYQYPYDTTTGAEVGNLFSSDNGIYNVSGSGKDEFGVQKTSNYMGIRQYFSRDNFVGTFPTNMSVKKNNWSNQTAGSFPSDGSSQPWYTTNTPTQRATSGTYEQNEIKLWHMTGRDYDDPLWEQFMNQLTVAEMNNFPRNGGFSTYEIDSIGKIQTIDPDGPFGFVNATGQAGNVATTVVYCSPVIIAQTYNKDLAYEVGKAVGLEGLLGTGSGTSQRPYSGIYGPGCNTHRSQFSGRNAEYYSEDPYIAGMTAAYWTKGAQSKGVYVYLKHYFLNDQETNRSNLNTWTSEQAMREIYARPFEIAIKVGGAQGMMTSFNRIGNMNAVQNYNSATALARNEWGFKGHYVSDWGQGTIANMIRAGVDMKLVGAGMGAGTDSGSAVTSSSGAIAITALRNSVKNVLYTTANSNAIQAGTISNRARTSFSTTYNSGQTLTFVKGKTVNYSVARAKNDYGIPYIYSTAADKLPAGLTLNADGNITGVPTTNGTYTFTVTAKDSAENALYPFKTASTQYTIIIADSAPVGVVYEGRSDLRAAVNVESNLNVGTAYNYSGDILQEGGFTYSVTNGTLPAGLTLSSATGAISGTPTSTGVTTFKITATKDGIGSQEAEFTINISEFYIGFEGAQLANGKVGGYYEYDLSANVTGNAPDLTFIVKDNLPQGLNLFDGVIKGTPEVAKLNCTFTIVVSSSGAPDEEAEFSMNIHGIVFNDQTFTTKLNTTSSFNLVASVNDNGSNSGFTFKINESQTLPNGMKLSPDGVISGKPNNFGTKTTIITVSKDGYADVEAIITIVVENVTTDKDKPNNCSGISTSNDLIIGLGAILVSFTAFAVITKANKKRENQ